MYKKFALLSLLFYTCTQNASDLRPWLELKPSYFLFTQCPIREIYNKGGFQIQGSASVPFRNYFDFYGSVGYRQAWGHALSTCEKTSLIVVPIDFGIKPVFNFHDRYYGFFAVGPRFFYLHQHNNSPYVDCIINNCNIGFFVNAGLNIEITDSFFMGIFGEYSYERTMVCPCMENVYSTGKVQIGGVAVGISFGYAF